MKTYHFLYLLLAVSGLAHANLEQAKMLLQQGHADKALLLVEQQLKAKPNDLQTRFLHAQLLTTLQRNEDAIARYEALTQDYPQYPEPYNNLAVLYAIQGEHNKARDTLLNALNTHSSYATAYENLGNIYTRMAIRAYNKALELDNKQTPEPIKLTLIKNISIAAQTNATTFKPIYDTTQQHANDNEIKLIIDTVTNWSNAWAAQNVDGYLSYYAPAFRPPDGLSRERWEIKRRQRLRAPRFIRITISETNVKILGSTTAKLIFKQHYESNHFKDISKKILLMEKTGDQWQILREYNT